MLPQRNLMIIVNYLQVIKMYYYVNKSFNFKIPILLHVIPFQSYNSLQKPCQKNAMWCYCYAIWKWSPNPLEGEYHPWTTLTQTFSSSRRNSISHFDMKVHCYFTIATQCNSLVDGFVKPNLFKSNLFLQVFAHVSLLFHTVSVWLTVSLCFFRCMIMLCQKGKNYTGFFHTAVAIVGVVIFSTIMVLPSFILLRVNSAHVAHRE